MFRWISALLMLSFLSANSWAQDDTSQDKKGKTVIEFKTNVGDFKVELFTKEAPISSENFLQYAKDGFYEGTIFHRVIDGFMIQGGGFDKNLQQKKTRAAIKNEAGNGLKNDKYTLAMARTSVPDSATSQFFINTTDNGFLNREEAQDGVGYAVFGRVIEGQDVIDKIGKVATGTQAGMRDVPREAVVVEAVQVQE
ncbi:MAG: peptidylprolyl isomerase [bacterium]|nr:peptidylprolyl isomerase [bacterium]